MQIVKIDLIPQSEKPIVNLSQYDNDRLVRFMLFENGEEYTLSGTETIDINIRKPDGNIVVITPTVTANNYVDVLFTEQATACYGESIGEISIKENSTNIGTCNFIMDVEKSPTCGGIQSDSSIDNLQRQIDSFLESDAPLIINEIAEPIVREEARAAVGAIGGSWFRFSLHVENTSETIYVPAALDGCICDIYGGGLYGLNITNVEELASTDHSTTLRITYDNSNFPSSTLICYMRYFNPGLF